MARMKSVAMKCRKISIGVATKSQTFYLKASVLFLPLFRAIHEPAPGQWTLEVVIVFPFQINVAFESHVTGNENIHVLKKNM